MNMHVSDLAESPSSSDSFVKTKHALNLGDPSHLAIRPNKGLSKKHLWPFDNVSRSGIVHDLA